MPHPKTGHVLRPELRPPAKTGTQGKKPSQKSKPKGKKGDQKGKGDKNSSPGKGKGKGKGQGQGKGKGKGKNGKPRQAHVAESGNDSTQYEEDGHFQDGRVSCPSEETQ